jgi:hypothetical protein
VALLGTLLAGGGIGLTATGNGGGIAQMAGIIAGNQGVALYTTGTAGATQSGGIVAAGGAAAGQGIAILAPNGPNDFSNFGRSAASVSTTAAGPWTLECPACAVALPASLAAPTVAIPTVAGAAAGGIDASAATGGVAVTLSAGAGGIMLNTNVLASTLRLTTSGAIVEKPGVAITAAALTGSAASAFLGSDAATGAGLGGAQNPNAIGSLAGFSVSQTLVLHDSTSLTIAGNLSAGPSTSGGQATGGGGLIDIVTDGSATQTGTATWTASRLVLSAQGNVTLASGGLLTVGTDGPAAIPGRYPRPSNLQSPFDPSTTTSYGASFSALTGSIVLQSQGVRITPLTGQTNPLARFILGTTNGLTPNSGVIDLTAGLSSPQSPPQSAANVILYLSNGTGVGSLNVGALEVFYTGPQTRNPTNFTNSSLLNAQGSLVSGTVAASAASIGNGLPNTIFKPSSNIRLNGCPIASVNCTILSTEALPAGSPLRDIIFSALNDSYDDPDFLLPSVSDQDY